MKMKKIMTKVGLVFLAILTVVGLFVGYRMITAKLTYSNMVDEQTLNEVAEDLLNANVPADKVELFKAQVQETNRFLGDFHSFNVGFVTVKKDGIRYDDFDAFNKFAALRVPYMDINCRVSSWNLFGDLISADPWDGNVEETFAYEYSTLHDHPLVELSDEERQMFYSLYAPIESDGYHLDKKNAQIITEEWKKRNVVFEENPNRTIINIFSYRSDNKKLEAQHSGVLIKRENDYLFVEKWNPTLPFQATIFKSRQDVKRYLDYRMNTSFLLDATIMENDTLFRP